MKKRGAILSWCLYDWAMSAYNTVIGTFIFSVYFTRAVADSEVAGTAQWGRAVAASGIAVALLSPVLGAIADRSGRRKPWLALFTALSVAGTALLWFVRPEPAFVLLVERDRLEGEGGEGRVGPAEAGREEGARLC